MFRTPTVHGRRVLIVAVPRTWRGWAPLGRCLLAVLVPLWVWPVELFLLEHLDYDSLFEAGGLWKAVGASMVFIPHALPLLLGFACLPRFTTRLHWRLGAALLYAAVMGPMIAAWWLLLDGWGLTDWLSS